jgi:hypothetical protein
VDLRRRRVLRLLLEALAEHRLAAPGAALPQAALIARGWPGERIHPDAAKSRLYTAIKELRSLGLGELLRWDGAGYLLDHATPLLRGPREP